MFRNKKQLVCSIVGSEPGRWLWRSVGSRALRILAYHRVLDHDPKTFLYDDGVISASVDRFSRQMRFVRDNFEVLSFADLQRFEQEGRQWPRRGLLITFDDGYVDNYTNAFPILKDFRLNATIFLVASLIDSREIFWWDLVAYCIKHCQSKSILFREICSKPLPLTCISDRKRTIELILSWLKRVPEDEKSAFLERLPRLTFCAIPAFARMHLSWAEVREMANGGVEFGCHSLTHPVLTNISRDQLQKEIAQSKALIEHHTEKPVITFSYPVGRHDSVVRTMVRNSGFRYAVSYEENVVRQGCLDCYRLPRIHMESEQSFSEFRSALMFPAFIVR